MDGDVVVGVDCERLHLSSLFPTAYGVDTPSSGSGSTQTFSFGFSDAAGASALAMVQTLISGGTSCYLFADVAHSTVYLLNDANTVFVGPLTLGSSGTLTNSQCTVNGTGSSLLASGTTLTLNLALTFKPAFAGAKTVSAYAQAASGANSGWQNLGAWIAQ